MRHTALWPCTHIPNKYYLKNNYLTLSSKVNVPRRSLRYATHHLMVMHPHTKYNWPIWKDKKVMVRTSFAEKKQKKRKTKTICLPSFEEGNKMTYYKVSKKIKWFFYMIGMSHSHKCHIVNQRLTGACIVHLVIFILNWPITG